MSINIETSLYLSTKDFKIVGDVEYENFGDGRCTEGHPIKHGIEVDDGGGNIYVFGHQCIFKPFVLKQWKLTEDYLNDPNVAKAGKNLYIIARDELVDFVELIPKPEDYNMDFAKLNEALKKIVRQAKSNKKKYNKELMIHLEYKNNFNQFISNNETQHNLILELNKKIKILKEKNKMFLLSNWDKEFISSIVRQHKFFKILSEKQIKIIHRIIDLDDTIELNDDINMLLTNLLKEGNIKGFDEKTVSFILSIQHYYYKHGNLSTKQLEAINRIKNRIPINDYIGKKVNSWIICKKFGIDEEGVIESIEKTTDKALLCSIELSIGNVRGWIPLKMVVIDN